VCKRVDTKSSRSPSISGTVPFLTSVIGGRRTPKIRGSDGGAAARLNCSDVCSLAERNVFQYPVAVAVRLAIRVGARGKLTVPRACRIFWMIVGEGLGRGSRVSRNTYILYPVYTYDISI